MPAHIFVTDRENYTVCLHRGVVGLPSASTDSRNERVTNDALISRLSIVKEDDYVIFYITGEKLLFGVWQAEGAPFYDETPIWPDKLYPYRIRIHSTNFSFPAPLKLNDIYDLQNMGKIWSFALKRASGSNAMFSISNEEFRLLLNEYSKINPFTLSRHVIVEPYPVKISSLLNKIHFDASHQLSYEASVMAYLLSGLTNGRYKNIFGNYADYLSYVPTTIGTEIDILLIFTNPLIFDQITSYDIIEVKRDEFDCKALKQLISYEAWFVQKKVAGDQNMVRSTALARSFSDEVIQYVHMRNGIEGKKIKLLQYSFTSADVLELKPIN